MIRAAIAVLALSLTTACGAGAINSYQVLCDSVGFDDPGFLAQCGRQQPVSWAEFCDSAAQHTVEARLMPHLQAVCDQAALED